MTPIPEGRPITISKKELQEMRERQPSRPKKPLFSPIELAIVKLICDQRTSEEIANELELSKRTVDDYRQQLIKKMKMRNSVGIALYAIHNGLYPLP